MASRDIRRAKAKQGATVSESIEKRRHLHPVLYALVVLVTVFSIIAFILLPMGSGAGTRGQIVFGTWDGREIAFSSGNYFARMQQAYARQAQESNSTASVESQLYGIWYQAFQATAWHVAELAEARRAGVELSKDSLDEDLLTWPAYLDEGGRFSETLYNATPLAERVAIREQRREELVASRYIADVVAGTRTGSREQAFVAAMAATERKFSLVQWTFDSFPDAEVKRYGEASAAKFRKAKLSRITVATEREAKQIRARLEEATASFPELAKAHSKDSYASQGGDMGWQYAYALEPDLEDKRQAEAVLALAPGEVGDPLKGPFGWALYRSEAEAVAPDFADAAVLAEVRSYLTRYEKGRIEDWFLERAGKFARRAAETSFAAAASEAGVAVAETGYFPINLVNTFMLSPVSAVPVEATPYSAAYSEDFFFRAFSLSKAQASSQPIVLEDRVVVLKVAGEQPVSAGNAALMDRVLASLANSSLQADLAKELDLEFAGSPARRMRSSFDDSFARYVLGTKG